MGANRNPRALVGGLALNPTFCMAQNGGGRYPFEDRSRPQNGHEHQSAVGWLGLRTGHEFLCGKLFKFHPNDQTLRFVALELGGAWGVSLRIHREINTGLSLSLCLF